MLDFDLGVVAYTIEILVGNGQSVVADRYVQSPLLNRAVSSDTGLVMQYGG